jgi:hypothetical protein
MPNVESLSYRAVLQKLADHYRVSRNNLTPLTKLDSQYLDKSISTDHFENIFLMYEFSLRVLSVNQAVRMIVGDAKKREADEMANAQFRRVNMLQALPES